MSTWRISYVEPTTVTFTLGDFLDSIEKNGLKQIQGDFWRNTANKATGLLGISPTHSINVSSACAIGQSALNLEVDYNALVSIINKQFKTSKKGRGLADAIIARNDGHRWKYKTIANHFRAKFADRLDETFEISRIISVEKG